MTNTDKAYIAGLLDGEGCITINRSKNSYNLILTVTNTNLSVLYWLKAVTNSGTIHVVPRDNPRWKTQYVWKLHTYEIQGLLAEIKPYLKIKRQQAELALEYISLVSAKSWSSKPDTVIQKADKELIYEEMATLNKKGK